MSTSIDERIVAMKFDNKEFERNAQTSMTTLDKLKQKLNFSDVQDKLGQIDTSSIKKSIEGIGDIDSSKMDGVLDRLEYRMSNFGIFTARIVENIADDVYNIVKKAFDGVEKVVTYAEQGIVQGGYSRASNIQSAKFQLEGLGIAWGDIFDDIDYAVTNTAYSLDQAAIVASQLASSGLKPGTTWTDKSGKTQDIDEMAMILRAISGTASATGGKADYADIGRIFTKMISYGKVYTQNLNELATYGIGAKGIVADYLNSIGYQGSTSWTESKVQDKMSDRKGGGLDPQLVIEAFYNKFAEHATAANETLSGVMANTKAALARIGESFFEPIIENGGPLVKLFEVLRKSINDVNGVIKPYIKLLGGDVADKIKDVIGIFATVDEEGNVKLNKEGGIFSSWMEPGEITRHYYSLGDTGIKGFEYETYRTRAEVFVDSMRITFNNLWDIMKNIGSGISDVFRALNPGFKGFADLIMKASVGLANVTTKLKAITDAPDFKNSLFFKLIRAIGAGIDIIIRFGKSFKLHILDPIFNKGASMIKSSGLGTWFRDFLDNVFKFDMKLREEGNEDYFGPFLENLKSRIRDIKDTIAGFLSDIVDWWRPVKDILFDTDLSFGEKLSSIKNYFSENFELPGWERAKSVFEKIHDAISKAIDKIRDFFGLNKKAESEYKPGVGTGSFGGKSNYFSGVSAETAGDILKNFDPLAMSTTVDSVDKSTDKLSGIGNKIADFFDNIKSAFDSVDVSGLKLVAIGILAVFILIGVGIAWTIKKIYDVFNDFVLKFPEMMGKIMESFNDVLVQIAGMFKAKKFEAYTSGLKNLSIAVAVLAGVLVVVALIVGLIKKYGGDEMIEGLREAEIIIGVLITVLGGLVIGITALTKNVSSVISIGKDGAFAVLPGNTYSGMAVFLREFAKAIAIIAGTIIVLGLIGSNYPDVIEEGAKWVGIIGGALAGIVLVSAIILNIVSKIPGINATAAVGSLAAMGSILIAFAIALAVMVPAIVILGLLPVPWLERGTQALQDIMITLGGIVVILMAVSTVLSGVAGLKGGQLALTILSMAALVAAVGIGIALLAVAMNTFAKMSPGDLAKGLISLIFIGGLLVAIPSILMAIFAHFEKADSLFGFDAGKGLLSIAGMILSIGAAMVAIAFAFTLMDKLGNVGQSFAVLAVLMLEMGAVIFALGKLNQDNLKEVQKTMLVMGGVFVAVGLTLAILTKFNFGNLVETAVTMFISIGALAVAVMALNHFVASTDKNAYKNLSDFAKSMMYVGIAMLPLATALVLILAVAGKVKVDPATAAVSILGFSVMMLALAGATNLLAESASKNKVTGKGLDKYTDALIKLATAMIPIAIAAGALMAILAVTDLNGFAALGIMIGLGGVIVAMGFALGLIIKAVSQVKDAKTLKAATGIVLAMAISLMAMGATIGMAALMITGSGIDIGRLSVAGVIMAAMMTFTYLMSKFMMNTIKDMRWNTTNHSSAKKVATVLGTYATVCLGVVAMAASLKLLARVPIATIAVAGGIISVMAAVVAGITYLLGKLGEGQKNIKGALANLGLFVGVCAGLVVLAGALKILSTFEYSDMISNLMAMGGVMLVALAVTALLGAFAILDTEAALATAGMLLGMGVTMAGVGIMLYLFAEALSTFLDTMIEVDGKADQIKGGVGAALTGFLEGLYEGLVKLNELIEPKILPELTKLFDSLFGWLETEIPKRFDSVLNVLKNALISISNFVNDPEVQDAVVGVINGILDILLENAEDWSSKVVQIGVKIGSGICDGINQAFFGGELTGFDDFLIRVGEAIDNNLLGGNIQNINSWFAGGLEAAEFESSWDMSYNQLANMATKMAEKLGYSEEQMRKAMFKKGESGYTGREMLDAAINAILGAEYLGNEQYAKVIEEHGGYAEYLGKVVEKIMDNASMSKLTTGLEAFGNMVKQGAINELYEIADSLENAGTDGYIQRALNNVGTNLQAAMYAGWDSSHGQYLRDVATKEMMAAIEACDDPEMRAALFELGKEMGIQFPEGYEEGWNTKKLTPQEAIKQLIMVPITEFVMQNAIKLATLGSTTANAFVNPILTRFRENRLGISGEVLGAYKEMESSTSKYAGPYGILMSGHINSIFSARVFPAALASVSLGTAGIWNTYGAIMMARSAIPTTVKPSVIMSPSIAVTTTNVPEGTINTLANIFKGKLQNAFGSSNFTYTGEMITAGLLNGMIDKNAQTKMSSMANSLLLTLANAIRKRFGIHSPAEDEEITEPGEMTAAGFMNSMVKYFKKNVDDASDQMATDTGDSLESSFNSVDLSQVGSKVSSAITSKFPSWDSLKSNFGWEKGLSGNIQGLKNAWGQIKDAFKDENGNFDVGSMFGGVGDSLTSVLGGITNGLNLNDLGFDPSSMGLSMTVDSGFDFGSWEDEFAGADINDLMNTDELVMTVDLNTDQLDEFMKENTTLDMATSLPTTGGYARSTVGNTYVNNYSYNQTNNSPTALNSREIRRQTELELNRRQRGGGFRAV